MIKYKLQIEPEALADIQQITDLVQWKTVRAW
jgi:hypothetical protein